MKAFVLSTVAAVLATVPLSAAAVPCRPMAGRSPRSATIRRCSGNGRSYAIDGCTRAIEEESLPAPDLAATYVNRGIVLMSAGRLSDADADFDSALKINATLPDGWLNKGFLRLRQGNGRDALPLIQKGIDAGAGRQALAIFARGVAHEQMGEYHRGLCRPSACT